MLKLWEGACAYILCREHEWFAIRPASGQIHRTVHKWTFTSNTNALPPRQRQVPYMWRAKWSYSWEQHKAWTEPPYNPDLNPIELDPIDLSRLKTARLQRNYSKLSKKQQRRLRARILKVGIAILTTCYMSPRTEGVVQQWSEGNIINALYNTS